MNFDNKIEPHIPMFSKDVVMFTPMP